MQHSGPIHAENHCSSVSRSIVLPAHEFDLQLFVILSCSERRDGHRSKSRKRFANNVANSAGRRCRALQASFTHATPDDARKFRVQLEQMEQSFTSPLHCVGQHTNSRLMKHCAGSSIIFTDLPRRLPVCSLDQSSICASTYRLSS